MTFSDGFFEAAGLRMIIIVGKGGSRAGREAESLIQAAWSKQVTKEMVRSDGLLEIVGQGLLKNELCEAGKKGRSERSFQSF